MAPLLEIRNAKRHFATQGGAPVTALDGLSLTVADNEFVTLLGPSGCGKTTLLRAISGFEDLDSGDILIEGASILNRPAHARPVNTVFQNYALFPHMNVARNVGYSLEVAGVPGAERARRVAEALELVGLGGYGERSVRQLSGGQQQRVALARAIVARPRLLLLDEPLSALDRNLRQRMQEELKQLQHGLGISFVFVTHDQEEALTMSDRIVVLDGGRIQQLGPPEDIYFRPENAFVARFVGESNLVTAHVLSRSGDESLLEVAGGARLVLAGERIVPGVDATLLFRPESVCVASGPDAAVSGSGAAGLSLAGRLTQSSFTGSDYRLEIDVPGVGPLKATVRHLAQSSSGGLAPGEPVALHVPSGAIHVLAGPPA